jgi:hypothetical protein
MTFNGLLVVSLCLTPAFPRVIVVRFLDQSMWLNALTVQDLDRTTGHVANRHYEIVPVSRRQITP